MDPFTAFIVALAFFHSSEFLLTLIYNRKDAGLRSFLVSVPYCTAMAAACLEYWAEKRLAPGLKVPAVSRVGLLVIALGEVLRKAAMVTAAHNFTHLIQFRKRPEHQLVVHGVYRWMRHPGYAGWFWWAVGTQLLLANPACTLAFAAAVSQAWVFFRRRIAVEEATLVQFFGPQYETYRQSVPRSGVPFIP